MHKTTDFALLDQEVNVKAIAQFQIEEEEHELEIELNVKYVSDGPSFVSSEDENAFLDVKAITCSEADDGWSY